MPKDDLRPVEPKFKPILNPHILRFRSGFKPNETDTVVDLGSAIVAADVKDNVFLALVGEQATMMRWYKVRLQLHVKSNGWARTARRPSGRGGAHSPSGAMWGACTP